MTIENIVTPTEGELQLNDQTIPLVLQALNNLELQGAAKAIFMHAIQPHATGYWARMTRKQFAEVLGIVPKTFRKGLVLLQNCNMIRVVGDRHVRVPITIYPLHFSQWDLQKMQALGILLPQSESTVAYWDAMEKLKKLASLEMLELSQSGEQGEAEEVGALIAAFEKHINTYNNYDNNKNINSSNVIKKESNGNPKKKSVRQKAKGFGNKAIQLFAAAAIGLGMMGASPVPDIEPVEIVEVEQTTHAPRETEAQPLIEGQGSGAAAIASENDASICGKPPIPIPRKELKARGKNYTLRQEDVDAAIAETRSHEWRLSDGTVNPDFVKWLEVHLIARNNTQDYASFGHHYVNEFYVERDIINRENGPSKNIPGALITLQDDWARFKSSEPPGAKYAPKPKPKPKPVIREPNPDLIEYADDSTANFQRMRALVDGDRPIQSADARGFGTDSRPIPKPIKATSSSNKGDRRARSLPAPIKRVARTEPKTVRVLNDKDEHGNLITDPSQATVTGITVTTHNAYALRKGDDPTPK